MYFGIYYETDLKNKDPNFKNVPAIKNIGIYANEHHMG